MNSDSEKSTTLPQGERTRVAFLVNGSPDSAMGERANSFAERLAQEFQILVCHRSGRKLVSSWALREEIAKFRPDLCYVIDMAFSGVIAAGIGKWRTHTPFIVDTGDSIVELGQALGRRGPAMWATRWLESYALRAAEHIVVRGTRHVELLRVRDVEATFIPDGVDVDQFAPRDFPTADDSPSPLTIGLVGTCVWSPARATCYGDELIELIRLLRDTTTHPVRGVLIGDGSGLEILKRRCRQFGLERSIEFVGRVPFAELPQRLRQFDICLSTQSNDVVGHVRTTGKLPLYLAAGKFVLASRVGEAARILPSEMLVEYAGSLDPDYPAKLAERVTALLTNRVDLSPRREYVELARTHFDYDLLAERLADVFCRVLSTSRRRPTAHR